MRVKTCPANPVARTASPRGSAFPAEATDVPPAEATHVRRPSRPSTAGVRRAVAAAHNCVLVAVAAAAVRASAKPVGTYDCGAATKKKNAMLLGRLEIRHGLLLLK
jgi:hypothetical protein